MADPSEEGGLRRPDLVQPLDHRGVRIALLRTCDVRNKTGLHICSLYSTKHLRPTISACRFAFGAEAGGAGGAAAAGWLLGGKEHTEAHTQMQAAAASKTLPERHVEEYESERIPLESGRVPLLEGGQGGQGAVPLRHRTAADWAHQALLLAARARCRSVCAGTVLFVPGSRHSGAGWEKQPGPPTPFLVHPLPSFAASPPFGCPPRVKAFTAGPAGARARSQTQTPPLGPARAAARRRGHLG